MNTELKKEDIDLGKQIKESLQGRKQRWLVLEMVKKGVEMTEVKLSNKLQGFLGFSDNEVKAINELLGTDFQAILEK